MLIQTRTDAMVFANAKFQPGFEPEVFPRHRNAPGRETRRDASERLAGRQTGLTGVSLSHLIFLTGSEECWPSRHATIVAPGLMSAENADPADTSGSDPLRGSGHRDVCSHCIRGLVEKAVAAAGKRTARKSKQPN
jgi:hypothetical protein